MKTEIIECGCGFGKGIHELGAGSCARKIATGSLIPTNFRTENGIKVCDVNGYTITEYTLRNQRLYYRHLGGAWSLPKDESSMNSIQMTD